MSDTMFDVMGELEGVTLDDPKSEPIPLGTYVLKINKVEHRQFDPIENSGADTGSSKMAVEYQIVGGKFDGRKIYTDYQWSAQTKEVTDAEGNVTKEVIPNWNTVEKLVNDGMSQEAAVEKSVNGLKEQVRIGKANFTKVMNAAGFIRPVDVKVGDKNSKRIEAQTAVLITPELGFTVDMLERKMVMGSTKAGREKTKKDGSKVTYLEVKNTWDVDPEKVGDTGPAF